MKKTMTQSISIPVEQFFRVAQMAEETKTSFSATVSLLIQRGLAHTVELELAEKDQLRKKIEKEAAILNSAVPEEA